MRPIEEEGHGVVFVDEAYSLARDSTDPYGMGMVDTLVQQITHRENEGTVFVLAGYPDEIQQFLHCNSGLDSRFPVEIPFPLFTPAACVELVRRELKCQHFTWEDGFLEMV